MKIDQYGELVSEIWPSGNVANLGNCMAETSRWCILTDKAPPIFSNLCQSLDPSCPKDWLTSSDQVLPYFIAMKCPIQSLTTPDGNLVSIPFWCYMYARWLLPFIVAGQALTLHLPFSWKDKTAAYLNWYMTVLVCPKWVRWFMSKKKFMGAVCEYYKPEPNSLWLVQLYSQSASAVLYR